MKTPLSKIWLRCALCALLLGMHACDNSPYVTEILLRANFNEDDLGSAPDKTLPGDPVGDELDHSYFPYLKIVNSPFNGGAPWALSQAIDDNHNVQTKFISRNSSFAGVIKISWNGQLVDWTGQALYFDITDGQGNMVARFAVAGQGLYVVNSTHPSPAYYEGDHVGDPFALGRGDAATNHVFIIEVNYAQKKFDITLAGQNLIQPVVKYTNLPVYNPNLVLAANGRPTLIVTSEQAITDEKGYIIDNVTISKTYIPLPPG